VPGKRPLVTAACTRTVMSSLPASFTRRSGFSFWQASGYSHAVVVHLQGGVTSVNALTLPRGYLVGM